MINKTSIKSAIGAEVSISSVMAQNIILWSSMYQNSSPWLSKNVVSLNLPSAISNELTRLITVEMKIEVEGDNPRAEYLAEQLKPFLSSLRRNLEVGLAKGGIVFKPYVDGDKISIDYVQADAFYPISFDSNNVMTSVVFSDQRKLGPYFYTRLEYHELKDGLYTIRNQAFRSNNERDLGTKVSLDSVDEWKDLDDEVILEGIEKPLYAYFRYPASNNIDPRSPLGVSCFSRAVENIKEADEQWSEFLWEFESGSRAIYADVLAFGRDKDNLPILPHKRLYRTMDMSASEIGKGKLFEDYTPTYREANILNGLDAILKRVEFNVGLAYGTLSDPQSVDKTATEIVSSRQRSASTVEDNQNELRRAIDHLAYSMDVWTSLDFLAPEGLFSLAYEFDDSVALDKTTQWTQDTQALALGIMAKVEFRMRNYRETEAIAAEKILLAQQERQKEMADEPEREEF